VWGPKAFADRVGGGGVGKQMGVMGGKGRGRLGKMGGENRRGFAESAKCRVKEHRSLSQNRHKNMSSERRKRGRQLKRRRGRSKGIPCICGPPSEADPNH